MAREADLAARFSGLLNRWAGYRPVGAIDAAMAGQRLEPLPTTPAMVEELARCGGHTLNGLVPAPWTGDYTRLARRRSQPEHAVRTVDAGFGCDIWRSHLLLHGAFGMVWICDTPRASSTRARGRNELGARPRPRLLASGVRDESMRRAGSLVRAESRTGSSTPSNPVP